jgi:hypothetical protein
VAVIHILLARVPAAGVADYQRYEAPVLPLLPTTADRCCTGGVVLQAEPPTAQAPRAASAR